MEAKLPQSLNLEGNIQENWKKFKQAFNIYMTATGKNEKSDEVRIAMLLNIIGDEGVEIFNNFTLEEAERKKYEVVLKEFDKYLIPRRNEIYERYKFYKREQQEGESVLNFIEDVKKLAKTCEFGCESNKLIRDRIVLGIRDRELQERLLSMSDLTLETAVEKCKINETTKHQVQELQKGAEVCTVNKNWRKKNQKKEEKFRERREEKSKERKDEKFQCKRCGKKHGPRQCPAYGKVCNNCRKPNHFSRQCRVKKLKEVEEEISDLQMNIDSIGNSSWYEKIKINNKAVSFKVDTGADVNVIPLSIFKQLGYLKLSQTPVILQVYGGFKIKPLGVVNLQCCYENKESNERFIVVQCGKPLLSLETCIKLEIIKKPVEISAIKHSSSEKFIKNNIEIFEGLGTFKNELKLEVKPGTEPVVKPPRRVPNSIKDRLKIKLDNLERLQVIQRVEGPVEWAHNIVIIEKPDKTLRLCLDPKDLNNVLKKEPYEIPTFEEIATKFNNKRYFSVLDLKDGFYQVKLDKKSSDLCTFSTPFGCYKFLRLPFGLSIAPEYFQKINIQNFGDIKGIIIYFDDILIAGETEDEHDKIMNKVIERAKQLNVKFNKNKIQYKVEKVKYLGHIFSKEGVRPDEERVRTIREMKNPKDKKELQRVLGLINYFRNFIPNLSEITASVRDLLKEKNEFVWEAHHTECLNKIKNILMSSPLLSNINMKKEIVIQTDSSKSGLGCCLMQDHKPVCYASSSLNESEINYSQTEKEFLAVVFACKKFHNLIYGKKVIVQTDHKPIVAIMKKNIADIGSNRLQRLKLKLVNYDLDVHYIPGKYLYVADTLSRAYLNETEYDESMKEVVHSVSHFMSIDQTEMNKFKIETNKDINIKQVKKFHIEGWPKHDKVNTNLKYFYNIRNDLQIVDELLFYKNNLIVPETLKNNILKLLHEGHFGITKTKAMARELYYWPGMNTDIENYVMKCTICEKYRSSNVKEPMLLHDIPDVPFSKVAADICSYGYKDYLITIDYYSKWIEILKINNKTASEITNKLKLIFSTHGIPNTLIADNMPFNSFEFKKFANSWGFEVKTSSPRYPKSNGMAESAVKIAKNIMKKNKDIDMALLTYRNTPLEKVGLSPSQLLMSRRTKTKLPIINSLLKPSAYDSKMIHEKILNKQILAKQYYDRTAKERKQFSDNENITIQKDKQWVPAQIVQSAGTPRSYIVKTEDNSHYRRNSSHIRKSMNTPHFKQTSAFDETEMQPISHNKNVEMQPKSNNEGKRKSERNIKKPAKFENYVLY